MPEPEGNFHSKQGVLLHILYATCLLKSKSFFSVSEINDWYLTVLGSMFIPSTFLNMSQFCAVSLSVIVCYVNMITCVELLMPI